MVVNDFKQGKNAYSTMKLMELKLKGKEVQGRTDWEWALDIEKATGQNLYRYEVRVESPNSEKIQSSLAVYLIKSN